MIDPKATATLPYWLLGLIVVVAGGASLTGSALLPASAAASAEAAATKAEAASARVETVTVEVRAVRGDLTSHERLEGHPVDHLRIGQMETCIKEIQGDVADTRDAVLLLCRASGVDCRAR